MQRRQYRLGKRQASVDETKRRILDAAFIEYSENGIEETTMVAVARRADVASGTVLYHYPEPDALADAFADRFIEETDWPEVPELPGGISLERRVDLLIDTVYAMYETGGPAAAAIYRTPHSEEIRGRLGRLSEPDDQQRARHLHQR